MTFISCNLREVTKSDGHIFSNCQSIGLSTKLSSNSMEELEF